MKLPMHMQLTEAFLERIRDGRWPEGHTIPSEQRLCEEFNVSRGPVRQALNQLRQEGVLVGGRGRPPHVARTALSQPTNVFTSFSAWATAAGHSPGQKTIELTRCLANAQTAEKLAINEGDPAVFLLRARSLNGETVMLERTWWTFEIGQILLGMDTDSGSTYDYLIKHGVDLFAATHIFDAVAASARDAEVLPTKAGAPLLRERRTAVDSTGKILEYSDDRYLPERANFVVHNQRTSQGNLALIDPTTTKEKS